MDQVQEWLDGSRGNPNWEEVLSRFSALDVNEQRRFSWISPKEADLKWLKDYLTEHNLDRLIGVGCGSGFLERIIGQFSGIPAAGIELKNGWWTSKYCAQKFIPIEFTSSPIDEDIFDRHVFSGRNQVLLFCYFNNSQAFNEYLRCFKGNNVIIVGPKANVGIHTEPMPLEPEFEDPVWSFHDCRYLEDQINVISLFNRIK